MRTKRLQDVFLQGRMQLTKSRAAAFHIGAYPAGREEGASRNHALHRNRRTPDICWNLWLAGRFMRRVWTWGKEMMSSRMTRIGVVASFCSAGLLLVGVATSASSPSFSPPKSRLVEPPTSTVERSHKGDRLMHFQTSGGASYSIAVEVTATSNVIVRDKGGNILFAVDQSSRTTTVGKQIKRRAVVPGPGEAERELPDGCEGAFSPYAEPSKARIIGRCVS
jgi:hypothetical protein